MMWLVPVIESILPLIEALRLAISSESLLPLLCSAIEPTQAHEVGLTRFALQINVRV